MPPIFWVKSVRDATVLASVFTTETRARVVSITMLLERVGLAEVAYQRNDLDADSYLDRVGGRNRGLQYRP